MTLTEVHAEMITLLEDNIGKLAYTVMAADGTISSTQLITLYPDHPLQTAASVEAHTADDYITHSRLLGDTVVYSTYKVS